MNAFLAHPWRWHRRPRSRAACLARTALEAAVLSAVLAVLTAWPWSPREPVTLRVFLGTWYAAVAVMSVVTMRRQP